MGEALLCFKNTDMFCLTDPLCCTPETNTLQVNYTPKNFKEKRYIHYKECLKASLAFDHIKFSLSRKHKNVDSKSHCSHTTPEGLIVTFELKQNEKMKIILQQLKDDREKLPPKCECLQRRYHRLRPKV